MKISEVNIVGFRNFKSDIIKFNEKTLILGKNDIGKSNLIYALRILLDKSLSENDLEPKDHDFYAYEETNNFYIQIKFTDIHEDCIKSKFKGNISEAGELFLRYEAYRDPNTNKKIYVLKQGKDKNSLEEMDSRYYLRTLNLQYVSSTRNLDSYIKREKIKLIEDSRENRNSEQEERDNKSLKKLEKSLSIANKRIENLEYIKRATENVNKQLMQLSLHHINNEVKFNVNSLDGEDFISNLELMSEVNGNKIKVGGDGRSNQIFLSLWASRNSTNLDVTQVTIYCIEEPEAHLHPHQQRKLSNYLVNVLDGQVIVTTHSPQIACEFKPDSIVRLYNNNPETIAANNGCSEFIEDAIIDFSYRLDIIPAEAFFSDVVLLVEGISEVLFYKALAKEIGIDLNRNNISILMVDGIGFSTYICLLNELKIPYVLRTDNDIFKIPNKKTYHCAGIKRCIGLYEEFCLPNDELNEILKKKNMIENLKRQTLPKPNQIIANKIIDNLKSVNMFVAKKDLENDMLYSSLQDSLTKYFGITNLDTIIKKMQKRKGMFMFEYLLENSSDLAILKDSEIASPLRRCLEIVGGTYEQ